VKRLILIYGAAGGLLIAILQLVEYRFLVLEHSLEIYGALVAAIFAGVGIWLGLKLTRKERVGRQGSARPGDRTVYAQPGETR
jgi:NarL family two-component system response regulator LiaR